MPNEDSRDTTTSPITEVVVRKRGSRYDIRAVGIIVKTLPNREEAQAVVSMAHLIALRLGTEYAYVGPYSCIIRALRAVETGLEEGLPEAQQNKGE